jgi:hypothetical protein
MHYFSRVRRMKHGHIRPTFIPSGTQLKVKIHRALQYEILSYYQDFFVDFLVFQMLDDFTAAQLNTMIPMGQSETFPIILYMPVSRSAKHFYTLVLNIVQKVF